MAHQPVTPKVLEEWAAMADAYDDHAKPSVVAVTVSGTYRSTQAVYPVLGELRTK